MNKPQLLIHTASLYYWHEDYANNLDARIDAALSAGLDGVEISCGAKLMDWKPTPSIAQSLRNRPVTIHAETGHNFAGVSPSDIGDFIASLPFPVQNVTFHPDEITIEEQRLLTNLHYPSCIENMDSGHGGWTTPEAVSGSMFGNVGFTLDVAHVQNVGAQVGDFAFLFAPREIHLSLSNDPSAGWYAPWGYTTKHAMTHLAPEHFPQIPEGVEFITLEGLVPPDLAILKEEVRFVRQQLGLT